MPPSTLASASSVRLFLTKRRRSIRVQLRHMWIVALPAQVLLAVRLDVDLLRFLHRRVVAVALGAERAIGRALGPDFSRRDLVLDGDRVAGRARQPDVGRNLLGARDLRVAGFALLRNVRRLRTVRLVTLH